MSVTQRRTERVCQYSSNEQKFLREVLELVYDEVDGAASRRLAMQTLDRYLDITPVHTALTHTDLNSQHQANSP